MEVDELPLSVRDASVAAAAAAHAAPAAGPAASLIGGLVRRGAPRARICSRSSSRSLRSV